MTASNGKNTPVLELRGVRKSYSGDVAVENVDLDCATRSS
jgi:ABC-type sugar transport system ATPase subunit